MNIILKDNLLLFEKIGEDLLCEVDPYTLLKDTFTVEGESSQYGTKKHWFFNKMTLPAGFLHIAIKLFKANNINYTIYDRRSNLPIINEIVPLDTMEYRPEQFEVLKKLLNPMVENVYYPRGIIDWATNSGKMILLAGIIKSLKHKKILIITHRKALFDQLKELFIAENIDLGVVSTKIELKEVNLAMERTFTNRLNNLEFYKLVSTLDCILVDECHIAKAKTLYKFLSSCQTNMVYFFSGTSTDFDDNIDKMKVIGLSGKVLDKLTVKDLVKLGRSRQALVEFIDIEPVTTISNHKVSYAYNITKNEYRHGKILENCIGFTLISVRFKDHASNLSAFFTKNNKRHSVFTSESDDYAKELNNFAIGKTKILIATGVIKEGINLPNIDTIINAAGGKSKIYIKQTIIGRSTRAKDGHSTVRIVDFNDMAFTDHVKIRKEIYDETC